jgi:hypothetical protein
MSSPRKSKTREPISDTFHKLEDPCCVQIYNVVNYSLDYTEVWMFSNSFLEWRQQSFPLTKFNLSNKITEEEVTFFIATARKELEK